MRKLRSIPLFFAAISAAVSLASCEAEIQPVSPAAGEPVRVSLSASPEAMTTTRSVLPPSIEDKVNGVRFVVYDGKESKIIMDEYVEGTTLADVELVRGESYIVYAFANMGRDSFRVPDSDTGMQGVYYRIPSYADVAGKGMPMSGRYGFSYEDQSTVTVPLKRKMAKVTVNITLDYGDGVTGSVGSVTLRQPNGIVAVGPDLLCGAGSADDILSDTDYDVSGANGSYVLYAPENASLVPVGETPITSSRFKNPDLDENIRACKDILTYIETEVTLSGLYSGKVTYRSYLGDNATSDFMVLGNHKYVWNLTFRENGLQYSDWKVEQDLDDSRYFRWNADPIQVLPGTVVTYADHYSTNVVSGITVDASAVSSGMLSGEPTANGFTVSPDAEPGMSLTATGYPAVNPTTALTASTTFVVVADTKPVTAINGADRYVFVGQDASPVFTVLPEDATDRTYNVRIVGGETLVENGVAKAPGVIVYEATANDGSGVKGRCSVYVYGLAIDPASWTMPVGDSKEYKAVLTAPDNKTYDVTGSVTWGKADPDAPVTVSGSSYSGTAPCETSVTATLSGADPSGMCPDALSAEASARLVITEAAPQYEYRLAISPETTTIRKDGGFTYSVTLYTDVVTAVGKTEDTVGQSVDPADSRLAWTVGGQSSSVITCDKGVVKGVGAGTATVTATISVDGSITASDDAIVTVLAPERRLVALELSPAETTISIGDEVDYTVTAVYQIYYGDTPEGDPEREPFTAKGQLAWTSSDNSVASVSLTGKATGKAAGTVTIKATRYSVSGEAKLTVRANSDTGVNTEWDEGGNTELEP